MHQVIMPPLLRASTPAYLLYLPYALAPAQQDDNVNGDAMAGSNLNVCVSKGAQGREYPKLSKLAKLSNKV